MSICDLKGLWTAHTVKNDWSKFIYQFFHEKLSKAIWFIPNEYPLPLQSCSQKFVVGTCNQELFMATDDRFSKQRYS